MAKVPEIIVPTFSPKEVEKHYLNYHWQKEVRGKRVLTSSFGVTIIEGDSDVECK